MGLYDTLKMSHSSALPPQCGYIPVTSVTPPLVMWCSSGTQLYNEWSISIILTQTGECIRGVLGCIHTLHTTHKRRYTGYISNSTNAVYFYPGVFTCSNNWKYELVLITISVTCQPNITSATTNRITYKGGPLLISIIIY